MWRGNGSIIIMVEIRTGMATILFGLANGDLFCMRRELRCRLWSDVADIVQDKPNADGPKEIGYMC